MVLSVCAWLMVWLGWLGWLGPRQFCCSLSSVVVSPGPGSAGGGVGLKAPAVGLTEAGWGWEIGA